MAATRRTMAWNPGQRWERGSERRQQDRQCRADESHFHPVSEEAGLNRVRRSELKSHVNRPLTPTRPWDSWRSAWPSGSGSSPIGSAPGTRRSPRRAGWRPGSSRPRAGVRGHDPLGVFADAIAQMASRLKSPGGDAPGAPELVWPLLERALRSHLHTRRRMADENRKPLPAPILGWPPDQGSAGDRRRVPHPMTARPP